MLSVMKEKTVRRFWPKFTLLCIGLGVGFSACVSFVGTSATGVFLAVALMFIFTIVCTKVVFRLTAE